MIDRTEATALAPERRLRILQVGTVESGGGAASVAGRLLRAYRARGCDAWLVVGRNTSDDPGVSVLPDDRRPAYRAAGYAALQARLTRLAGRSPGSGWGSLSRSLRLVTHPRVILDQARGNEDFEFPGTYDLLDLTPARPDIVHCHNLHGGYFDLRALRWLSRRVPTVLTLHDAWLLSGHCAHSFECERWTAGCGDCPDLGIYPAIRQDATAANWLRKRDIFNGSQLYVATPCEWLMRKTERSMLAPAVKQARVIPYGVDRSAFHSADRHLARHTLGLPSDVAVVLLPIGRYRSPWGDDAMMRAAMSLITSRMAPRRVLFMAVDTRVEPDTAAIAVHQVAYTSDANVLAKYYQAADVYLHCARADTFPNSILEALACGTPVVASAVGGIPEQIRSADLGAIRSQAMGELRRSTGLLVPPGDAAAMAEATLALLSQQIPRARLGENAVRDVGERFDLDTEVDRYLAWYRTIIDHWKGDADSDSDRTATIPARQSPLAVDGGGFPA